LALVAVGVGLVGLGGGLLLREASIFSPLEGRLSLNVLPAWLWGLFLVLLGGGGIAAGVVGMNRALLSPFADSDGAVVDALYRHRKRGRGPKVVAIGGGHGLSTLLGGLKAYTSNVTAIVTVADDGGSSGRLRRALGVLPPGDFRNCIAALADDEALTTQLFQYRFPATSGEAVDGHTLGNLLITAMVDVTGSFERAVVESGRVLAIQGRVLPSTLESVTLVGDLRAAPAQVSRVAGESHIAQAQGVIERVALEPDDARAYPEAVRAILEADLIVAGPGSLYTSVLPNLLVREIAQAIAASRAVRVYVCNVATQGGETDGYTVDDHVNALERHVGPGFVSCVLANKNMQHTDALPPMVEPVRVDDVQDAQYELRTADLVDPVHPWRHDRDKLARALMELVH
jgi:uncharacterized cofD-like protein